MVEPQFEERPWADYVKELARRIGFGEAYDFTLDELWDSQLAPNGIDYDYLKENGVYYATPTVTREVVYNQKKGWKTDTGRLNLYAVDAAPRWLEEKPNPHYNPLPLYHPITVSPQAENEFYLLSGKCSYFWCNFFRDNAMLLEEYLQGELANTKLWINAGRAAKLGIKNNDWVRVESAVTGGRDRVQVKVTEGIHPDASWHIYGSGHRASLMSPDSHGRDGLNVQDFVPPSLRRLDRRRGPLRGGYPPVQGG